MQKIHLQNEDVRLSHVMGLHKIPYTRETWHAKLENTLAGLAESKDKQPQHFCILSLVLHFRGWVLTPGLLSLSLSSSSRTKWVTNILCHFYHIFYQVWLTSTSSITLSRYALITMPEILHVCSHSIYRNVTKTVWMKACKSLFLGFSALIFLFIAGRDPSTFWLPFSHPFFFPVKSVSYPKLEKSWLLKKRLLSDLISEGYSYWLDSLDKLSSRRPKCKDMEDKTAIAKSKGNTPFFF